MTVRIFETRGGKHRAGSAPGIPAPRSLMAPVDERIEQLELAFRYVHVAIDPHFEPADCRWCDRQGTTSVRVYGDESAVPDAESALVVEEVCQDCALKPRGPVYQAWYESRSDRDIRIEVCA